MPRQKRPLSEADANATNPPTKRASKGSTSATDENAASPGKDYESMTNRQLSDLLKARGLKHNWNSKEVLIMALRDSDAGNPKIFRINQPSAKRDATAATANDYDSMTKMELSDLLKARGLLYSGPNKAALIQRLREAGSGSGQVAVTVVPAPAPVPGLDFVTMCRPHDDVAMEKKDKRVINEDGFEGGESAGGYDLADVEDEVESDEDEEEEGHANIPENRAPDGKCMCRKPAKDFPEWKWVISKRGLEIMMLDLMKEFWKRDQDAHGDYNCNDWTGYGVQEVMENQLLAIDKDIAKNDAYALWPHIEALAAFVPVNNEEWWMADCCEDILDTLKMIGGAVMVSLDQLEKQDLLKKGSPVSNIALVLGKLKYMIQGWPGDPPAYEYRISWADAALLKAKRAGVEFGDAPYGIKKAFDDGEVEDWDFDDVDWENFNWKKQFANYKKLYRKGNTIGGSHYTLVKEKKKKKA